jgi:hypothetical protein
VSAPGRAFGLAPPAKPVAEAPLELIPALSEPSRVARRHGFSAQVRAAVASHELGLPGIGGRYLAGVARHVAAHGWPAGEVAALVAAMEDRCSMWIVCSSATALVRAGVSPEGVRVPRAGASRFSGGRWQRVRIPTSETVTELMHAGTARGAVCAAAESGRFPPSRLVGAAAAGGAHTASMDRGLASVLGAAWAIELLVAPAIPSGSLVALREQVAAAPRCGWCRSPLVGSTCRRCAPAIRP